MFTNTFKYLFGVSICLAVFIAMPVVAYAQLYDDFNDNALDFDKWGAEAEVGTTLIEINNQLELSILPTAVGDTFGSSIASKFLFNGDFDVQVEYDLTSWPADNGVRTGFGILGAGGNVAIERSASSPADTFPERYLMQSETIYKGETTTTDLAGELRLQRIGAVTTGYYRAGAETWQVIASFTNAEIGWSNTEPLQVQISTWSHNDITYPAFNPGGQIVTAGFDTVSITATEVTCPTPTLPTSTVNFVGAIDSIDVDNGSNSFSSLSIGDPISGTVTYGSDASEACFVESDPPGAIELSFVGTPYGGFATVGSALISGEEAELAVVNDDDISAEDTAIINTLYGAGSITEGTIVDGWLAQGANNTQGFGVLIYSLNSNLYASADFQGSPPASSASDFAIFYLYETDALGNEIYLATGKLTSLGATVSESVPIPFFALCALLFGLVSVGLYSKRHAC